ncbi:MAG TPA: YcnI family protein [Candidatus Saccharimonadales bacterium]|nr:YcnI family protein [Candidatus Saccharimonadales bacterium]
MKKLLASIVTAITIAVALPAVAFAHVIVTPNQADVGASTKFNVSVPNEKEVAVTSVKLDIPKGVQNASPDVMAGWNITTTADSSGNVTSITWTGGIPVGQRADFAFKAQLPANATELDWKAYQTYADGTVVQWDQNPATNGKAVKNNVGPYSVTKVVNDLNSSNTSQDDNSNKSTLALVLSIVALVFSLSSLFLRRNSATKK